MSMTDICKLFCCGFELDLPTDSVCVRNLNRLSSPLLTHNPPNVSKTSSVHSNVKARKVENVHESRQTNLR